MEHRSLETVWVDMWLSFPYAYSMRFALNMHRAFSSGIQDGGGAFSTPET